MLSFESFEKLYQADFTQSIGEGGFSRCFRCTTRSNIIVRIANLTSEDYFPANLTNKDAREQCLSNLRLIFDEWSSLLVAQQTHAVKLEAFSFKLIQNPTNPGELGFQTYTAMELLSDNLYKMYKQNHLLLKHDAFKQAAIQLLESLEFFEKVGLWHGDIKPQNIMTSAQGEYKLIDFGTAKFTPHFQSRTAPRALTEAYSRPDYANLLQNYAIMKVPKTLYKKNDQFSVGMTLLHLATNLSFDDLITIRKAHDPNLSEIEKKVGRDKKWMAMQKLPQIDQDLIEMLLQGDLSSKDIKMKYFTGDMDDMKIVSPDLKPDEGKTTHTNFSRQRSLMSMKEVELAPSRYLEMTAKIDNQQEKDIYIADLETTINNAMNLNQSIQLSIKCRIDDIIAVELGDYELFSRIPPDVSVVLDLIGPQSISDKGALGISKILSSLDNPTILGLNLYACDSVTDSGFIQIITGLDAAPNLQELYLNFGLCDKLTKKSLAELENVLSRKTTLTKLYLFCDRWKLFDSSIDHLQRLLLRLNKVQEVGLRFNQSRELTDQFANKLLTTLTSMTSLKTIKVLNLDDTSVTAGMMNTFKATLANNNKIRYAFLSGDGLPDDGLEITK